MKNYIIAGAILVLLTLASLFLPSYVLEWQDEQRTEHSETEEVQEVVLKEQLSMSLAQKMELRQKDTVNALNLYKGKNYDQETIDAQVRSEIEILAEKEILMHFSNENIAIRDTSVLFYVDMEDSERSVMIWEIAVDTTNYHLILYLDDETGKIVSFTQYVEVTDYLEVDKTGQVSGVFVENRFDMSGEEVQELAERWGEYLGCQVTEFRSAGAGLQYREEREVFMKEVETLVRKGYSWEEANLKIGIEWGIAPAETTRNQILAEFKDEGGQVDYIIWPEGNSLWIEPV